MVSAHPGPAANSTIAAPKAKQIDFWRKVARITQTSFVILFGPQISQISQILCKSEVDNNAPVLHKRGSTIPISLNSKSET
jgi:hypothetical protein